MCSRETGILYSSSGKNSSAHMMDNPFLPSCTSVKLLPTSKTLDIKASMNPTRAFTFFKKSRMSIPLNSTLKYLRAKLIQLSLDQNLTNSFEKSLVASCVFLAIKTLLGKSVMPPSGIHKNCSTRQILIFINSHFKWQKNPRVTRKLTSHRTLMQNRTFL